MGGIREADPALGGPESPCVSGCREKADFHPRGSEDSGALPRHPADGGGGSLWSPGTSVELCCARRLRPGRCRRAPFQRVLQSLPLALPAPCSAAPRGDGMYGFRGQAGISHRSTKCWQWDQPPNPGCPAGSSGFPPPPPQQQWGRGAAPSRTVGSPGLGNTPKHLPPLRGCPR